MQKTHLTSRSKSDNMPTTEGLQMAKKGVQRRLHSLSPPSSRTSNKTKVTPKKSESENDDNETIDSRSASIISSRTEDIPRETSLPLNAITTAKLMRTLATKKREFFSLRKRLLSQQDGFIELLVTLRELESRLGCSGEEQLGEVRILSVTQWPPYDLLLLIREDLTLPSDADLKSLLGFQIMERQRAELNSISGDVNATLEDLTGRRLAVLQMMRTKHRPDRSTFSMNQEWKAKNVELDNETEQLQKQVTKVKKNLENRVTQIMELSKTAWIDREILANKLERSQREVLQLQNKLEANSKKNINSCDNLQSHSLKESSSYQTVNEELNRSSRDALKEQLNGLESTLRAMRTRAAALERQLKEVRAEKEVLQQKYHELEKSYHQRDLAEKSKPKKTDEEIETLIRDHDELELRLIEAQEQARATEAKAIARIEEERVRYKACISKLTAKDRASEARIFELQAHIKELEGNLDGLRNRSAQLLKIESQCADLVPTKDNGYNEKEPNDREMEMWKELQEMRESLAHAQSMAQQYRDENENLLHSLSEIIEQSTCESSTEDKLAAELLNKEKKIMKMQKTIDEQRGQQKVMQTTISRYEQQLLELRLEINTLRHYNSSSEKDIPYQDLQNEVMELQMKLMSLNRERSSLLSTATSRALMLERHERAAQQFVRVTRLRRELSDLVAPQHAAPRSGDPDRDQISHSLSTLCMSTASQWSALQNAQARMTLLERTVMSQKEQLERESSVRMQLEHHRQRLERDLLQAKKNNSKLHIPILTELTAQIQGLIGRSKC